MYVPPNHLHKPLPLLGLLYHTANVPPSSWPPDRIPVPGILVTALIATPLPTRRYLQAVLKKQLPASPGRNVLFHITIFQKQQTIFSPTWSFTNIKSNVFKILQLKLRSSRLRCGTVPLDKGQRVKGTQCLNL